MPYFRLFFVILCVLYCTSCTLRPVLTPEVHQALTHVYIQNIPDAHGHLLRLYLNKNMQTTESHHHALYILKIEDFNFSKAGVTWSRDAHSSRYNITGTLTYTLLTRDHALICSDQLTQTGSYGVVKNMYSDTVAEEYLQKSLRIEMADHLTNRIASCLNQHLHEKNQHAIQKE